MWPDRDELEVRLMMDLFKHVTGTTNLPLPLCLLFNTTGSDMTFQARQPGLLVHTDCDVVNCNALHFTAWHMLVLSASPPLTYLTCPPVS